MSEDEHKVEYTTVSIPRPLADKIKERIKGTGFPSISSYVVYVLRQVLCLRLDVLFVKIRTVFDG